MLLPVFLIAISAYSAQAKFSTGKCLTIPVIQTVDLDRVNRIIQAFIQLAF